MLTTHWTQPGMGIRLIRAEWHGGAYIELTFHDAENPTEVINVYDYAAGAPTIPFTQEALDAHVREWCDDYFHTDPDGPENLRAYLENAAY